MFSVCLRPVGDYKMGINVIDLFASCGGLSCGFIKAGFNVILGVDIDPIALKTFEYNHKQSKGLLLDLHDKNAIKSIAKAVEGENVDVIIGGPPCQGFSLTGTRNFEDKRNSLYLSFLEAVSFFKPKAFLIENVAGMATLYKGVVKDEIIKRCTDLGYNVTSKVVCAADYGVPQNRKRLIFVGVRKDVGNYIFPEPLYTKDMYISCKEAISDLPSLEDENGKDISNYTTSPLSKYQEHIRNGSAFLYNHVKTNHSKHVINVISQVPDGGNYKDLPEGVGNSRNFHVAWTRYNSNRPSNTIDTGHRNHFHYKWNRIPTVRENARLQSFPDTFRFLGTKTQQYKQVGNAVPPILAEELAKPLKIILDNDEN